eukprot:365535-Chlamydomonas_euryale.AAC.63
MSRKSLPGCMQRGRAPATALSSCVRIAPIAFADDDCKASVHGADAAAGAGGAVPVPTGPAGATAQYDGSGAADRRPRRSHITRGAGAAPPPVRHHPHVLGSWAARRRRETAAGGDAAFLREQPTQMVRDDRWAAPPLGEARGRVRLQGLSCMACGQGGCLHIRVVAWLQLVVVALCVHTPTACEVTRCDLCETAEASTCHA